MGFLAEYQAFAESGTDAPTRFHEYAAMTVAGTLIGRNAYVEWGHDRIFPNLWTILLAGSSQSRKSTSVGIARRMLVGLGREQVTDYLLPDDFSREGLTKNLSSRAQGMFVFPEFATILKAFGLEYMGGTKELLTHLYDSPSVHKRTLAGGEPILIRDAFVSVLAASTVEWLLDTVKEDDFRAGFYPRFIFVTGTQDKPPMIVPKKADAQVREPANGACLSGTSIT